jgi:hypothetical protein
MLGFPPGAHLPGNGERSCYTAPLRSISPLKTSASEGNAKLYDRCLIFFCTPRSLTPTRRSCSLRASLGTIQGKFGCIQAT